MRLSVDALHFAWRSACAGRPAALGLVSADAGHAYLLHRVRDLGVRTVLVFPGASEAQLGDLLRACDHAVPLADGALAAVGPGGGSPWEAAPAAAAAELLVER